MACDSRSLMDRFRAVGPALLLAAAGGLVPSFPSQSVENGTHATLRFDRATGDGAFGALDVADRTRTVSVPPTEGALAEMYDPFVDAFLETVRGHRDDTGSVVDTARLALAVEVASTREETVTPDSEALTTVTWDGEAFLADYEPYC